MVSDVRGLTVNPIIEDLLRILAAILPSSVVKPDFQSNVRNASNAMFKTRIVREREHVLI